MIRLTLILAVAIFAVLVLAPQRMDVTEGDVGQAVPSGGLVAPDSRTDPGAEVALREGPDGRMVLRTTTGEDLPIDLIVDPSEFAAAAAEADTDAAAAGTVETSPPDTAGAQPAAESAPSGVTRLRVTGDRVNFRAGPSTQDEILAALTLGTEVDLIERVADGWVHLRVPATGLTGYMSGDFLEPAN
jgi:hypothetical protein